MTTQKTICALSAKILVLLFLVFFENKSKAQIANKHDRIIVYDTNSVYIKYLILDGAEWFIPILKNHEDGNYVVLHAGYENMVHMAYTVKNHTIVGEIKRYKLWKKKLKTRKIKIPVAKKGMVRFPPPRE